MASSGRLHPSKNQRKFENVEHRAGAHGARFQNLRGESFRTVGSFLNLVRKNAISRAGVGDHFRKSFRCILEFVRNPKRDPRKVVTAPRGCSFRGVSSRGEPPPLKAPPLRVRRPISSPPRAQTDFEPKRSQGARRRRAPCERVGSKSVCARGLVCSRPVVRYTVLEADLKRRFSSRSGLQPR